MKESLKIRNKFKWNFTLESTTDNRDMSIYTLNLEQQSYVDEIKKISKNSEFIHVQYRIEFLQAILSAYYLLNYFCYDNKLFEQELMDNFVEYSDIDLKSLEETLQGFDKKAIEGRKYCAENEQTKHYFQGPPPSRLFVYMKSCHHELMRPTLSYLNNVVKYFYNQSEGIEFNVNAEDLCNKFKQELESFKAQKSFHSIRKFIEYSSLSLESINFLLLMVEMLSSAVAVLKPGKKFKKLSSKNSENLKNFESEVSGIIQNTKKLADFVAQLFAILRESYKQFDDDYFGWINQKQLQTFAQFEVRFLSCSI